MKLGLSLSPGGLLFPYHLGVLDGLAHHNVLTDSTALAGASAGAIAVACHACGLDSHDMLKATAELSTDCYGNGSQKSGGGSGSSGLVQGLRGQMNERIQDIHFDRLQKRTGLVGIAYQELLPRFGPVLQTSFESAGDLTEAVCHSSSFPFFSIPSPFGIDTRKDIPRLVVDGFFTVPRERFGCPDFAQAEVSDESHRTETDQIGNREQLELDRTICISCFPQDVIGLTAVSDRDCISPAMSSGKVEEQMKTLFQVATQPQSSGFSTYLQFYENGLRDAEAWVEREKSNNWQLPQSELSQLMNDDGVLN